MLLNTVKFTGTADNFLIILELFSGRFCVFFTKDHLNLTNSYFAPYPENSLTPYSSTSKTKCGPSSASKSTAIGRNS
jgi:hypothetical protein